MPSTKSFPPCGNLSFPEAPAPPHRHISRAICRRAERSLWRLSRGETVNCESLKYLNRLSDLLFVLARHLARQASDKETTWNRKT
ncbi:ATP:cob(I)alamin adenosyltransferase [Thiolapillus sp.]|uniref:ATP:cob(I)alamin adenosyltransferase n=1 Tax=Thiolapillus sp. TaxID=2017437 RepID=UPI003AF4EAA3